MDVHTTFDDEICLSGTRSGQGSTLWALLGGGKSDFGQRNGLKPDTRGVTSQFPADFWFDMTDGAGNCATARASLSLEDLENEMRRAITRPVHHNEFFSQRWAIFAPPPVFCPTPGDPIGTTTGPDSKSKGTTGKSAERRPTPPPSAAALDLTEAGCGPRPVRRKIARNLAFFGSISAEKFSRHLIFGSPMVIVLARLILSETL